MVREGWNFKRGWGFFLGVLAISFISVLNHGRKTFESNARNVLKEFEIFIIDENLLKACDSTLSMYREFEPCFSCCIKFFSAVKLVKWEGGWVGGNKMRRWVKA